MVVGSEEVKYWLFCGFCGVFLGCVLSDRRIERKFLLFSIVGVAFCAVRETLI